MTTNTKLDAARKVAVALGKVRSKLKKDIEKEEARLTSNEPVVYNGESYATLEEAQEWYGCGCITSEDLDAIRDEFDKRQNSPELETLKSMKSYYDILVDYMRDEVEKLEHTDEK